MAEITPTPNAVLADTLVHLMPAADIARLQVAVGGPVATISGAGGAFTDLTFDAPVAAVFGGGSAEVTQFAHTITSVAVADLSTITGAPIAPVGATELVYLQLAVGSAAITVRHGTIVCPDGRDITLATAGDGVLVFYNGTAWRVVASYLADTEKILDIGRATVGYFYFIAQAQAADQVQIGAAETWDGAVAPGAGEFAIGASAANSAAGLVAAINASAASQVEAVQLPAATGTLVALVPKVLGTDYALVVNIGGARIAAPTAAAMQGNATPSSRLHCQGSYTVQVTDVTAWAAANNWVPIASVPSTAAPTLLSVEARDTNGIFMSKATIGARLVQVDTRWWALMIQDAAAVLANTDVLTFDIALA